MSPALRIATISDLGDVATAMTTAFDTDPVWGAYSFPDPARRAEQSARFWEYCIRTALRFPHTFVTPGCEAAAVWIPPGEPEMTPAQEAGLATLLTDMLGAAQAGIVMDAFALLDAAHPHDEPHHYLSLLATHRAHRGRGLGMELLGMCLEQIDRAHLPAYLESTNPANDARYARHGFRPHSRLELPNGAPVTTMWRDAR